MISTEKYIFTDASFSKTHQIAVIGFIIFNSTTEYETKELKDMTIHLHKIQEANNIRAEIRGALFAIKTLPKKSKIILYSDCQTLIQLPERQKKLEATNFISQSKHQLLKNADIYTEFYSLTSTHHIELNWIKGHTSVSSKNKNHFIFSKLDKEVRKQLRKYINEEK